MVFPATPLPIRAEMQIDGTWTEVTTDVRSENGLLPITITGGFAPEQTSITPQTIDFTLNDRDGTYADDNVASPYFELLPVNTPFRVAVEESTPFLRLPNEINVDPLGSVSWDSAFVQTADKAVLDVTGDLDLRIEIEPDQWVLGTAGQVLAAKYDTVAPGRSWLWAVVPSGQMRLYWSADGNNAITNGTWADSTEPIGAVANVALRVTIDVNNGAAGRTITFYTSDSITGTWTQLGDAVVQSGTTSIFSSSAALQVAAVRNTAGTGTYPFITTAYPHYFLPTAGKVWRFQMYSGIAGTLVADMNASAQAEGTTSWSDGLGTPNTWTLFSTAEITVANYRGYGEISSFPHEWDITGTDVYAPMQASGIMRRITQGAGALRSPIYRNLSQFIGDGALGYWPLEGGSQSTTAGSAIPGQPSAQVVNVTFASDSDFPGSAGGFTLTDDNALIRGSVTARAAADQAFCIFYVKIPTTPGATTEIFSWYTTGTCRRVAFGATATNYRAEAFDSSGTSLGLASATFGSGAEPGQWLAVQLRLNKNGTGVDLNVAWFVLGASIFYGPSAATIASAVVGAPISFATTSGAASLRCVFAHVMMGNRASWEYATSEFAQASIAYVGERAATRYLRLCLEEGVAARVVGWPDDSEQAGAQSIDTLQANLDACVAVEFGLQCEARDQGALVVRTRASLYAQPAVELTYTSKHLSGSFRPTSDDLLLRNEVTVNRTGGSFAVARRDTGRKSYLPPPDGAGRYASSLTLNAFTDNRLSALAGWAVGVGTWPDKRVPNLEVWLERSVFTASAALTRQARTLNPGDRVSVASTPAWAGSSSDMLVRGYVERLLNRGHQLAFSTVPYGPYESIRYDATSEPRRYDVRTSTLQTAMTDADTWAYVASTSRRGFWSWKSVHYDVVISGQVNTVLGATRPDNVGVADSSFETGDPADSGWYASVDGSASTFTGSSAQAPYGTYSALITVAGAPGFVRIRTSYNATTVAGGKYPIKAWVRRSSAGNVDLEVDWSDSGFGYLSSSSASIAVAANTWTEISTEFTAPASAVNAYHGLAMTGSPAAGTLLYVKNVDMLRSDVKNGSQVLLLSRGTNGVTKALSSGKEVHIDQGRPWALGVRG